MTKVSAAADAMNLGAVHPEACVAALRNRMGHRLPEARPTRVAIEFCFRREDRQITARTGIRARPRFEVELAGERDLGTLPPQHDVGSRY